MTTWELFLIVDKFHIFKFIFAVLIFFAVLELIDKTRDNEKWTD